jgi:adhesin transport system membrane fusion protein
MLPLPDSAASFVASLTATWRQWPKQFALMFVPRLDDSEFMQESSAAVMEGPHYVVHWILWSVVLLFGIAFVWASFTTIDQITVGEGKVISPSQLQVVQNLEGGIISELLVKVGDTVQKEQVVARLDQARFASSLNEGQAKNQALSAKIVRLKAEANDISFESPAWLEQENRQVLSEEEAFYKSRQHDLRANLAVLNQQAEQRRHELSEKRSRVVQLQESYRLVAKEVDMTRPLAKEGVVSEVEFMRLERQANDLKGDLDANRLMLPRLEAAYQEIRQKMDEVTKQFLSEARKDLNQALAEQSMQSAANTGLEDRLTRTHVRAPMAGIVKQIKVNTLGGVIQPGMDLMEIVPFEDSLLIEARVLPADIAFLKLGQEATVKLSAYDFSIYGGFPATLEHISADTLVPDRPGEKPEPYYQIRVRTKSSKLSGLDQPVTIMPGMVATVDIKTGKRTILQYLLKPIIKTKELALRER